MNSTRIARSRWAQILSTACLSCVVSPMQAAVPDSATIGTKDTVTFDLGSGPRHVRHWRLDKARSRKGQKMFWMATSPGENGVPTAQMQAKAGIVVENAFRNDDKVIYRIRVTGDADSAVRVLQTFPEYLGLEPVVNDDKVHADLFHQRRKDQVRKWARSATSEPDSTQMPVELEIRIEGVGKAGLAKAWARKHRIATYEFTRDSSIRVKAPLERLEEFSDDPSVSGIKRYSPPGILNDAARALTNVGKLQYGVLDTSTYGVANATSVQPQWNAGKQYTGEGVYIGIWDTGIDTLRPDFQEAGKFRTVPGVVTTAIGGDHGTHVAGIAAGNGQSSERFSPLGANGRRYQWRGVAPKARLYGDWTGFGASQDVNNHSHITSYDAIYEAEDQQTDDSTANHDPNGSTRVNNIVVYAAGNNGQFNSTVLPGCYGMQAGYFSMLVNGKNAIKVGMTSKTDGVKSTHSSMGPTRDGRLGPDVVAPGGGGAMPILIEIDSVTVRDSKGIKPTTGRFPRWTFDSDLDGWSITEQARKLRQESGAIVDGNGALVAEGSYSSLWAFFGGTAKIEATDSILMRIRLKTLDTWPAGTKVQCGWYAIDDPNGHYGNPQMFDVPVNQWVETRVAVGPAFSAAPAWNGICLHVNAATPGIISTKNGGGYVEEGGTSMAAPHVSGIVALLLQKYGTNYLAPVGKNVHKNPFWNSTAKALLIHTATDMVRTSKMAGYPENPDFIGRIPYPQWTDDTLTEVYTYGPDWATGYGLVNAQKAISFVDTNLFKERTIGQSQMTSFRTSVPTGQKSFRATLAWDDPGALPQSGAGPFDPLLMNDLDLVAISPSGKVSYPWVIDATPLSNTTTGKLRDATIPADGIDVNCTRDNVLWNPAFKGRDSLNNVEVVDVENPEAGEWTILVHARKLLLNENPRVNNGGLNNQDFSLVSDFAMTPGTTTGIAFADPTGSLAVSAIDGSLRLKGCTGTPAGTTGLVFWNNGAIAATMDRPSGFKAANVLPNSGTYMDNQTNLAGGLLFTNSAGINVMHISKTNYLRSRGPTACSAF